MKIDKPKSPKKTNQKVWLTVEQSAEKVERSPNTIRNWINQSNKGLVKNRLLLRKAWRDKNQTNCRKKTWLIEEQSLIDRNQNSVRMRKYVKPQKIHRQDLVRKGMPKSIRYESGDSPQRVEADRRKWVDEWVAEGKSLDRILRVFNPYLHPEISGYYSQSIKQKFYQERAKHDSQE